MQHQVSETPSAFRATFSDFKLVKTRKTAQLIFEVAIEAADAALQALGGLPRSDAEVWCAIARLDPSKPASEPRKGNGEAVKERRKFGEMPLGQQAAMRCSEIEFWKYLEGRWDRDISITSKESAAELVRDWCGVKSRSGITDSDESGRRWRDLNRAFLDWKHAVPLAEPSR